MRFRRLLSWIVAAISVAVIPVLTNAAAGTTAGAEQTGPVRVFALLRRRPDLDSAAFSQHWRTRHAEASLKLAKYFDRYVQNHLGPEPYPGFARAFDGAAELWYPNLQRSIDLGNSEEYRSDAYHDNFRFQDVAAMRLLNTQVVQTSAGLERPAPPGAVKAIVFWKRRDGVSALGFRERFVAATAPLLLPRGHYAGFERGLALSFDADPPTYDAFEQVWWPSEAAYRSDVADLDAARLAGSDLVDAGASMALRVEELYWYWPPRITVATSTAVLAAAAQSGSAAGAAPTITSASSPGSEPGLARAAAPARASAAAQAPVPASAITPAPPPAVSAPAPPGGAPAAPSSTGSAPSPSSTTGDAGNITVNEFDINDPATGGRGGELYVSQCGACHDRGLERAPQRAVLAVMSPQAVYQVLTKGTMATQAAGLSEADKLALAEFITKRKMSSVIDEPEPPACAGRAAQFDYSAPPAFSGWGLTPDNSRSVPTAVAGLGRADVGRLRLRWAVSFPNAIRMRGAPAVGGGAVFIGSHNGQVYALDEATGCVRWRYLAGAEVRTSPVLEPWHKGDRSAKPRVYFGDLVGNVYALDARDGSLIWRRRVDAHPNAAITATPTLFEGRLYVPVSSFEIIRPANPQYECCTFRGSVVALDAKTGDTLWQTFTIDAPATQRGTSVRGVAQYGPSGAPVWNSPAIDVRRRQLLFATGGNYSSPATGTSDAVMALDLASGHIRWVYQGLAGDAWNNACIAPDKANCPKDAGPDHDFGAAVILTHIPQIGDIVVAGQKTGWVHAVDAASGQLRWKVRVGRGGILGGIHFGIAANRGRVYAPVNDAPDGQQHDVPERPGLYALDLATGREVWAAHASADTCGDLPLCWSGYTQAITVTPELVFAGSSDGWIRILDADSGTTLWQYDTKQRFETVNGNPAHGGSMGGAAAPIVFAGSLYVASGYGFGGQMPGNVLLAFDAGEGGAARR